MNWYKKASHRISPDTGEYILEPDPWIPVNSSFISAIRYNEPLKIFEVKLMDGHEYGFSGVSKQIFNRFMKSKSKGEFFNRVIKHRYGVKSRK